MFRRHVSILAVLFAVVLYGCDQGNESSSQASRDWSKTELAHYAIGKTKAEIREELGRPSDVIYGGNTWMYTEVGPLHVYDPDAQVRIGVFIKFNPATQRVESVQYP